MHIRMKQAMAGPDGVVHEGQVVEKPDEVAQRLIDGGYAEAVDEDERAEDEPETATAPPAPETATAPPARKGTRKAAARKE